MIKKLVSLLIIVVILAIILATLWVFQLLEHKSPQEVTLYFKPGTSLRQMSQDLYENNVIPKARLLEILVRLQGKEKQIKAGEYEFARNITPPEVVSMLLAGKVKLYPITIPEGYNLNQIGGVVVSKNIGTQDEWNQWVRDKDFIQSLNLPTEAPPTTLEGYLFPDTYHYNRDENAQKLIAQMVELFKTKVTTDMINQARDKGFSVHEWVTLASIIEKETGLSSERPLIASVFLNRLKMKMLLQTDPTVIYGIPNFNGNLTKRDLETDTPYNTYTRPGLPAGPICSPGLDSLLSVLHPAEESYIYFVSKGDGSHYFSRSLEEHNQAVNFYQLKRGSPPQSTPEEQPDNTTEASENSESIEPVPAP